MRNKGVLKFTTGTEQKLLEYVLTNAEDSNPQSVINCIDEFCWKHHWMMHIGDEKGNFLEKTILEKQPINVLELGTYCGYSTILMLKNMKNINSKVYTIDPDEYTVNNIAKQIIKKAGLLDRVVFLNDYSYNIIPKIKEKLGYEIKFDLVFIDHEKNCYYDDLLLLEKNELLAKNVFLVADNVIVFKIDNYYNYVMNKHFFDTQIYYTNLEYNNETIDNKVYKDGILVSKYL